MWNPSSLGRVGRTMIFAAGIAALAGTSAVAFDNMTAEQRAALEASQAETAGADDADAGGERTIFDGVYTEAQAERGMGMYNSDCSGCHGNTGRGGPGSPGLVGFTLDSKYANKPLSDYWNFMVHNMPPGNAGWFTDQEYADVTAYLLQLHGAPAGDTELEGSEEALSTIMIVPTPEG